MTMPDLERSAELGRMWWAGFNAGINDAVMVVMRSDLDQAKKNALVDEIQKRQIGR